MEKAERIKLYQATLARARSLIKRTPEREVRRLAEMMLAGQLLKAETRKGKP